MKAAIKLTISGAQFFFEDNNFSTGQLKALQEIATNISNKYPGQKDISEYEVCKWFLNAAQKDLEIDLHEIKISSVLRINK